MTLSPGKKQKGLGSLPMYLNPDDVRNVFATRLVVARLILDSACSHHKTPLRNWVRWSRCLCFRRPLEIKDKDSGWTGLSTQIFLPGQVDTVSKLRLPTSVFPTDTLNVHTPSTFKDSQGCWVLFKGIESKPKIWRVQFPVPDHTKPENEAAFRAAVSTHEPAVQLWLGTCGNCHTPYSARCCSRTPKSGGWFVLQDQIRTHLILLIPAQLTYSVSWLLRELDRKMRKRGCSLFAAGVSVSCLLRAVEKATC